MKTISNATGTTSLIKWSAWPLNIRLDNSLDNACNDDTLWYVMMHAGCVGNSKLIILRLYRTLKYNIVG